MPKQENAWLIPANRTPANRRCIVLYVPDDPDHIANFWGAILPLAQWQNWERDDIQSGKVVSGVWKGVLFDALMRFRDGICLDPGVVITNETVKIVGVSSEVGNFGFSIEELEDMLMGCLDISGSIRLNEETGLIELRSCDGWVTMPGQTGALQTTTTPTDELAPLGQAREKGFFSLIKYPWELPSPPAMTTSDSQRCAKASAMVDGWFSLMGKMKNIVYAIGGAGVTVDAIIAYIAIEFASGGVAGIAVLASALSLYIAGASISEVVGEIEGQIDDDENRIELACSLTNTLLNNSNGKIESLELLALDIAWRGIFTPTPELIDLMELIPTGWVRDHLLSFIPKTECHCEEFLPYQFASQPSEGQMAYNFKEFGWVSPFDGAIIDAPYLYAEIKDTGQIGTLSGGKPLSVGRGTNSPGGVLHHYHNLCAVYEFNAPVTLNNVSGTLFHSGGLPSTMEQAIAIYSDGEWTSGSVTLGNSNVPTGQTGAAFSISPGAALVEFFAIYLQSRHTGGLRPVMLDGIRISGVFDGSNFTNLEPGQIFSP